jgi:hypothetical protein
MSVAGSYTCVTKTPMGDQTSTVTIVVDGDTFTGTNSGPMGSLTLENGKVDGNRLTWKMQMTSPMPMTLEGDATVDGDTLTGSVKAGPFGSFPMNGTRVA